jgi:hypothetical protein
MLRRSVNFKFFKCPGVAKGVTLKNINGTIEEKLGSKSFLAGL